jgi:KDEL-tailed cysteine endopeptidase
MASDKEPVVLPVSSSFAAIDWVTAGCVNPIQDQAQCGSCWAFSAVASMEGAVCVDHQELLKFSEQQLVSCSTENSGCNGGMAYNAFQYYETHGEMAEAEYPYTARDGTCKYNSSSAYRYNTRLENSFVTVTYDDLDQMYAALKLKPLSVSICASATSFHTYSSGIFNDPTCGDQHNHATNVVGYGTEGSVDYWLMRNSWGTDWGESGYMRLEVQATGNGICGIQMWPTYPLLD